jgi:pre-mRNA-splicing factor SYF1
VQALFNTEVSYLAAQTVAARQGTGQTGVSTSQEVAADPMAAAERATTFVRGQATGHLEGDIEPEANGQKVNEDEIQISDEE